jgi:hypothetical protein
VTSTPTESQRLRILAYGIEKKGLPVPKREITADKYKIEFSGYNEATRFQDFDGVIIFQGTFESFTNVVSNSLLRSYLKHTWDRDELDKRTKETRALLEKGGIVCMMLSDPFIDFDDHRDFSDTDLSKRLLSLFQVSRRRFSTRITSVKSKVNELGKFFELYGAAWSWLQAPPGDTRNKVLASTSTGREATSMAIDGNLFVLPTLTPKPTEEAAEEYFTILADGIVTLWERLRTDLPEWASEYRFHGEPTIPEAKAKLANDLSELETRLKQLERLKRALVLQGEPLVEAVIEVFEKMLPLKPRREEAFREDLTLIDSNGNAVALVEAKGVSKGVTREHVNQADSHRERNGMSPEFPSILIINTNMKNSVSLADKDQSVATEQILHACRNNVLILRTLDLLNLVSLHLGGKLTPDEVVELLIKSRGWLKVGNTVEILTG